MAEHMLILGVEDPEGKITYLAAAMPSASGKTNLAMVVSSLPGYRVWTVGDDIAWIHVDKHGQLRATNPERGFFGVAPEHQREDQSERGGHGALQHHLHQRRADPGERAVVGRHGPRGAGGHCSTGRASPGRRAAAPAAHPNSRFTVPAQQCPSIAPNWEDPEGVPLSGFIFGSRRARVVPLVFEAFDWDHGVFLGSAMGTETTAAITGQVGIVRRDPMAMIPFCGYNMADYFAHWLSVGPRLKNPPKIFRVNWFRRDADGQVPLARLRGERAHPQVDRRAHPRHGGAGRWRRRSAISRRRARSIARGSRCLRARSRRRCTWTARSGGRRSPSSASSTSSSASGCRRRSGRPTRRRRAVSVSERARRQGMSGKMLRGVGLALIDAGRARRLRRHRAPTTSSPRPSRSRRRRTSRSPRPASSRWTSICRRGGRGT